MKFYSIMHKLPLYKENITIDNYTRKCGIVDKGQCLHQVNNYKIGQLLQIMVLWGDLMQ